jgi:hypothetical protein
MIFLTMAANAERRGRWVVAAAALLALAGCAETDNPASSHLAQVPAVDAATGQPIIEAGDIAIVGQLVAHSLMALPEVADAEKPPLVQFTGVTSVVTGPVDTSPYTELLRDRLLLLTREKLRFVERQLPPLTSHKIKHHKDVPAPIDVDSDADYQILAELRGNFDDDDYHIQVQFVDLHSSQVLFNGLYRIRKEAQDNAPQGPATIISPTIESTAPNPANPVDPGSSTTTPPPPSGDSTIQ